jgi:aminopeptidase-like protein
VGRVLREADRPHRLYEFSPDGYDERQYASPGVDLSVGRFSRTPYGTYPEYHTSADDLDFIRAEALAESLETMLSIVGYLEDGVYFENLLPKCEPQLGRRGLYSAMGGHRDSVERETAMLWVLNLSDGSNCLAAISERSRLPLELLEEVSATLADHGLLQLRAASFSAEAEARA